jgi:phosphonate transport system ATP-binding protein
MINVRNLKKSVGPDRTPLLKGVNLHVKKGEFVAIIGGGGSGKTTLLTCMSGRNRWDEGDIFFRGESLKTMNLWQKYVYRKECAYLAQQPQLHPNKTAAKNVLSGRFRSSGLLRMATGLVSKDEHFTAHDYLDKVGLLDKAHLKADQLSGGEKQRVAIGRALAWGAKVIYADEPISGLDPHSGARVMEDFRRLCKEDGLTVICCLNKIDLAETYCSRIVGLKDGVISLDVSGRRLTEREKRQILD